MYYLLMTYFSIFNIYYLLPISHPLSMELPFILLYIIFFHLLPTCCLLSIYIISHLYLCPPPFYLPTIYVSFLCHLYISIICLSVRMYIYTYIYPIGLVVEPCLTQAWVRTTVFMLKQVPASTDTLILQCTACPLCYLHVAVSSDHHNKVSGFSRLVFAMTILYRGGSRLGQVSHHGWSHTTVTEQEQEHRPVLVPCVFSLSWVKPEVTGMTCVCQLVSYLST